MQDLKNPVGGFGPGAMIATADGILPVDWLGVGDRVITRDRGAQPLRWIGRQRLTARRLDADPRLRPVRIAAGADAPLLVAPGQRLLVTGAQVQLLFGLDAALAQAGCVGDPAPDCVSMAGFTYYLLLFDRHETVLANGLWCESRFAPAGCAALTGVEAEDPPGPIRHDRRSYPALSEWEAALFGQVSKRRMPRTAARAA